MTGEQYVEIEYCSNCGIRVRPADELCPECGVLILETLKNERNAKEARNRYLILQRGKL